MFNWLKKLFKKRSVFHKIQFDKNVMPVFLIDTDDIRVINKFKRKLIYAMKTDKLPGKDL